MPADCKYMKFSEIFNKLHTKTVFMLIRVFV